MQEALALAERGRGQTSPNPTVGAIVVRGEEVIGRGFHTWAGVDHAEVIALREAGAAARGATLYVTLEPCLASWAHWALCKRRGGFGVARVVAAMQDPNPQVAGTGIRAAARGRT